MPDTKPIDAAEPPKPHDPEITLTSTLGRTGAEICRLSGRLFEQCCNQRNFHAWVLDDMRRAIEEAQGALSEYERVRGISVKENAKRYSGALKVEPRSDA